MVAAAAAAAVVVVVVTLFGVIKIWRRVESDTFHW